MNKSLISIVAVAFVALLITNAYAPCCVPPPPPICPPPCPGLTPGFWKHNIRVYLHFTNGKYSALPDGTKLTDGIMDDLLEAIQDELGLWFTFELALERLQRRGWSAQRTRTANWFNWAAGYGPFED